MHGFLDQDTGKEHVALTLGDVADGKPVLGRLHSECLTGDALFSLRCDCGFQLEAALRAIGELQVQVLALEGAVLLIGDPMDDRQAPAGTVIVHAESPRRPAPAPGPIECAGSNMFMSPKC